MRSSSLLSCRTHLQDHSRTWTSGRICPNDTGREACHLHGSPARVGAAVAELTDLVVAPAHDRACRGEGARGSVACSDGDDARGVNRARAVFAMLPTVRGLDGPAAYLDRIALPATRRSASEAVFGGELAVILLDHVAGRTVELRRPIEAHVRAGGQRPEPPRVQRNPCKIAYRTDRSGQLVHWRAARRRWSRAEERKVSRAARKVWIEGKSLEDPVEKNGPRAVAPGNTRALAPRRQR